MKGTLSSVSRKPIAFGMPYTGLASSITSTFARKPPTADCRLAASEPAGAGREEHAPGLVDAADERVQRVHGERGEQAVGVRERRAADNRDGRRKLHQLPRQPIDALRRHARDLLHALWRVVVSPADQPSMSAAAPPGRPRERSLSLQNHVREAEREDAFGARLGRHPLVRVGPRQRHPRLDLDELAARLRMALPHGAVVRRMRHRRVPRAQEIGAKRDDESRAREVERRELRVAEAERVGAAQNIVAERLEPHRRRRPEPACELGEELQPPAAPRAGHQRQRLLIAGRGQFVQLGHQLADGLVPANLAERAGAARSIALHRLPQAIGVIGHLNRRLPAGTESAAADRDASRRLRASSRPPSRRRHAGRCGRSRRPRP